MTLLLFIQVFHILSGTIWLCSFIFIYFILWPSLVKNNTMEALVIKNSIKKPIGIYLGMIGVISIILGVIRGTFFGGINNYDSLFTPYGKNFISAILISFLMIIIGRVFGHNLVTLPWKDENSKKKTLIRIYIAGAFILICYALLLLCMAAMRFGGI